LEWGIFFILVTLHLCLLLIHRYLWNSQKWQILISVNRDLIFFYFLRSVYGKGVQNTWTSSFKQVACLILMCNCLVQKINMIMMFCFYLIFNLL
jgi:hypothetical protein